MATVAFGMGIDKPDVRFVFHHSLSKSMENFYQESGRAGRDDVISHCILYYRPFDAFRQSTMVFTEQTGLQNLYGMLAYCQDTHTCRRTLIGQHFGEVWDPEKCGGMCDHCQKNHTGSAGSKGSLGLDSVVRACVHACVRACARACARTCVRACMRACMHIFVQI